jgi:hypothetical protein
MYADYIAANLGFNRPSKSAETRPPFNSCGAAVKNDFSCDETTCSRTIAQERIKAVLQAVFFLLAKQGQGAMFC